eukprot:9413664-Prorocentrum_lima.AAC.1
MEPAAVLCSCCRCALRQKRPRAASPLKPSHTPSPLRPVPVSFLNRPPSRRFLSIWSLPWLPMART